jgi:hypothetical protein
MYDVKESALSFVFVWVSFEKMGSFSGFVREGGSFSEFHPRREGHHVVVPVHCTARLDQVHAGRSH